MKPHGAIMEFSEQRDRELLSLWRREAASVDVVRCPEIAARIVMQPASRFYVSEERAANVISAISRGVPILGMKSHNRKQMFLEIYQRYTQRRSQYPNESERESVSAVVNSPAPCFYIQPRTALEIIIRSRKKYSCTPLYLKSTK